MLKKIQTILIKANYRWLTKYLSNLGVGTWSVIGTCQKPSEAVSLEEIVSYHFNHHSSPDHVCRITLHAALEKLNTQPACILETGSSAWGSNSSLLFDSYIRRFGGQFESVDLRIQPSITLQEKCSSNTVLHCDDSVNFLEKWSKNNPSKKIDLLYLDSWDVDWLNPTPSALHGLAEFIASSPNLKEGSLLLIDDTPVNSDYFVSAQSQLEAFNQYHLTHGFYPGKGSLVKQLLLSMGRGKELLHQYQLLWEF